MQGRDDPRVPGGVGTEPSQRLAASRRNPFDKPVRIQILTALIVYVLLRLARIATGTALALQPIARPVAKTTFPRRPLAELFDPPPDRPQDTNQLEITFAKS